MNKKWIFLPDDGEKRVREFAATLNVHHAIASILIQRNIDDFEKAKAFFRPSLENLFDPFLMKDMDVAVERLCMAISSKQKILVYGDYDVDGTSAVALVYSFLRKFHSAIEFYIPDRYKEGYGISDQGIQFAIDNGIKLVICLDCGIRSVELIEKARNNGVDFIVCDHHKPGSTLPPAVAVLDPKREDCGYPYDELTGCGVGFKLLQGFCIRNKIDHEKLFAYLDLLAISIAADIVPITGENRILTFHGIKLLESKPRPGLRALLKASGISGKISVMDLVFGIGPRVNAAGRIHHARDSVNLLISDSMDSSMKLAETLNAHNSKRKEFDSSITEEALAMIEESDRLLNAKSTVLFKPDWHKGVIGIVASRCIERYYRPTIILTQSEGTATGSARSVEGFDIHEAINNCSDLLMKFGGHTHAAGLTMHLDNVQSFVQRFESEVSSTITIEQLTQKIIIDHYLPLDELNSNLYKILRQIGPFGPGNMLPVFYCDDVVCTGTPRILKDKHLKMFVKQQNGKRKWEAIGFNLSEHFNEISSGQPFLMAYSLDENQYMGQTFLQVTIKDIKFGPVK
jgi:single-stranded-DNA-specific exonuclease